MVNNSTAATLNTDSRDSSNSMVAMDSNNMVNTKAMANRDMEDSDNSNTEVMDSNTNNHKANSNSLSSKDKRR